MAQFPLSEKPRLITADETEPKSLSNAGGDPIFYSREEAPSRDENEGSLGSGESMTLEHGLWVVSGGSTQAAVFDARQDTITRLRAELAEARS